MALIKPHLASDWNPEKQTFPVVMLPKIDGVRGLNPAGQFVARSLKKHGNLYTSRFYSEPCLIGLDGELAAEDWQHPDLCRLTTSATSTHDGAPFTLWWIFDLVNEKTQDWGYLDRLKEADSLIRRLQADPLQPECVRHLRIVPHVVVHNMEALEEQDAEWLEMGFEGSILRDPNGKHKNGRCTVREGAYLRIKRFIEEEAYVMGIIEGQQNMNDAQENELGRTFRSTHQENMVPNGMVGAMQVRSLKDGAEFVVGAGKMPHADRKKFFDNPELLLGKIIKYQHFPKGVKDKPRFPTFKTFRDIADMG